MREVSENALTTEDTEYHRGKHTEAFMRQTLLCGVPSVYRCALCGFAFPSNGSDGTGRFTGL